MIRFQLKAPSELPGILEETAFHISLSVTTPRENSLYRIETKNNILRECVAELLSTAYGAYGHALSSHPTGFDLWAALKSKEFEKYSPVIVEGAELIIPPPPMLEGAVSQPYYTFL